MSLLAGLRGSVFVDVGDVALHRNWGRGEGGREAAQSNGAFRARCVLGGEG